MHGIPAESPGGPGGEARFRSVCRASGIYDLGCDILFEGEIAEVSCPGGVKGKKFSVLKDIPENGIPFFKRGQRRKSGFPDRFKRFVKPFADALRRMRVRTDGNNLTAAVLKHFYYVIGSFHNPKGKIDYYYTDYTALDLRTVFDEYFEGGRSP